MKPFSTLGNDKMPLNGFLEMKSMGELLTDLDGKILIENKYTKEEAIKIMTNFYSISEEELLKKFVNLKESKIEPEKKGKHKEINEFVKFSIDKVNGEIFTTLRTFSNDNDFKFIGQTGTHRIYDEI